MKINQLCVFVGTRQGVLFFFKSFGYLCSFADWEGVGHTCTWRWWELDLKARPIVCFPPNVTYLRLVFCWFSSLRFYRPLRHHGAITLFPILHYTRLLKEKPFRGILFCHLRQVPGHFSVFTHANLMLTYTIYYKTIHQRLAVNKGLHFFLTLQLKS